MVQLQEKVEMRCKKEWKVHEELDTLLLRLLAKHLFNLTIACRHADIVKNVILENNG
jgi:hypothetical protein